jgi:hypothetical protein
MEFVEELKGEDAVEVVSGTTEASGGDHKCASPVPYNPLEWWLFNVFLRKIWD